MAILTKESLDYLLAVCILAVTLGKILLYVDTWVHRREGDADKLKGRLVQEIKDRTREVARLDKDFAYVWAEIKEMGKKQSDFGTGQQAEVLSVAKKIIEMEGNIKAILALQDDRRHR